MNCETCEQQHAPSVFSSHQDGRRDMLCSRAHWRAMRLKTWNQGQVLLRTSYGLLSANLSSPSPTKASIFHLFPCSSFLLLQLLAPVSSSSPAQSLLGLIPWCCVTILGSGTRCYKPKSQNCRASPGKALPDRPAGAEGEACFQHLHAGVSPLSTGKLMLLFNYCHLLWFGYFYNDKRCTTDAISARSPSPSWKHVDLGDSLWNSY